MTDPLNQTAPVKRQQLAWVEPFLAHLSQWGNVGEACREAKISREAVYQRRLKHPAFAARWQEAIDNAVDTLKKEAWRRARDGTTKGVYYQGERVDEEQVYSDALLQFLLKAHAPEEFDRGLKLEVTGKDGEPLKTETEITVALHNAEMAFLESLVTRPAPVEQVEQAG